MTAAFMWVRADLRRRWRSWVVLGILAGVSAGIAGAAIAGARRTEHVVPNYAHVVGVPDAAILANDPSFDDAMRARIAQLPEIKTSYPFIVPFALQITAPAGLDASLIPTTADALRIMHEPIVKGRAPDPTRADEMIVNQVAAKQFHLGIGSTVSFAQRDDDNPAHNFEATLRIVGIEKSTDKDTDEVPSSGFYTKYKDKLVGFVNEFVSLKHGAADYATFRTDTTNLFGKPVNIESGPALFGLPKLLHITDVTRDGILLFALGVILGAGALVGQALVRAVLAGGVDLSTWRALGADRNVAARAMVLPSLIAAGVAAVTSFVTAVALSPRFPIAQARRYDLHLGVHLDWTVLLLMVLSVAIAIVGAAIITSELRLLRGERRAGRPSLATRATNVDMPPSVLIGSRLATEPGVGRRAVPVRSALIGAIVGVLGFVGCLTFRSGLTSTVSHRERAGIVWDYYVAAGGPLSREAKTTITHDPAVSDAIDAQWARAVRVNGQGTPVFGMSPLRGGIDLVLVKGRAPKTSDEIAFAPHTLASLHANVGGTVRVGEGAGRLVNVVGEALLPVTSHTDYDESGWMTKAGLAHSLPPANQLSSDFIEEYALIRWHPGADVATAQKRLSAVADYAEVPALPPAVDSLGELRSLPLALAIFFALLASATVAHALVTTVRRRGHDLAVLRSIGFTRRNTRLAIAWQATLLAFAGLVVGVPVGIVTGRVLWRQLAINFPVIYVAPLALIAVLLAVPIALILANLIAAGPAHAATRVRPAEVLRAE